MGPAEIITAPYTIWTAPYGTAFPAPPQAPGAGWQLLGKRGARSYSEDGVAVQHLRQFSTSQPAGTMGAAFGFTTMGGLRVRARVLPRTLPHAPPPGRSRRCRPGARAAAGRGRRATRSR